VPRHETFHWTACRERLLALDAKSPLSLVPKGRFFQAPGVQVWVPGLVPIRELTGGDEAGDVPGWRRGTGGENLEQYLARLPEELPRQVLILMQAGAVSLGYFEAGEAVATKTLKRYVVRGKGRAQPTYLGKKGKSRYGSRLRLQNARLLFEETNTKLREWWDELGPPAQIFCAAPKRLWPELFLAKVSPPFAREEPILRVPLDLPVPTTETLLRTYKAMGYGRIEWERD
jgi:hypothetical protein